MDFDYAKLKELTEAIKTAQFVPMDPAAAGAPPPGGDPAAAGMPPPGDPAAAGAPPMDPVAAGMPPPGDPAAGGMPPTDPSMMDPAAMGIPPPDPGDVSPSGEPYMKITPTQLTKLIKQFAEVFKNMFGLSTPAAGQAAQAAPAAPAQSQQDSQQLAEVNAKLDAIMQG